MRTNAGEDDAVPAAGLPFAAPLRVEVRKRHGGSPVERRLDPAECTALARFLDVMGVEALAFDGRLSPWGEDGWEVDGRLTGVVIQACVRTLAPVEQVINQPVTRRYLPRAGNAWPETVELGAVDLSRDDSDEPDPIVGDIDLAVLMVEALALALDPYPRASDTDFAAHLHAAPGVTPLSDEAMRPFAKLAALKQRLEGDKGSGSGD